MPMIMIHRRLLRQFVALLLIWTIALPSLVAAQASLGATPAATPAAAAAPGNGVTYKICQPGVCFVTKADKEKYAKDNNCRFLEDVCEGAKEDNKGPNQADRGFWGENLWNKITQDNPMVYGYNFVRGLLEGVKSQLVDLWDFVTNMDEVFGGLVELGKAFYNDPKGTIVLLGDLIGQEAVDTLTKATQCGAYDLGKVIGSYVSPAVALKLATKLTKFGGKLPDAVKATKAEIRCASFAGETPILSLNGLVPIGSITVGNKVFSRNELSFADAGQEVTQVFERVAPTHRVLRLENDVLRVTDEHPLWVQGKGWTEAKEIQEDDVVAANQGDALVLDNIALDEPLKVHNFSVARTPNYFAGAAGLWAHNTKCDLPNPYRAPPSPSNYAIGASDGGPGGWAQQERGWTEHIRYEKQVTGAPKDREYRLPLASRKSGYIDIDGFDATRKVLIDAKHYSDTNPLINPKTPAPLKAAVSAKLVKEAKDQLEASKGTPIEWHVADQTALNAVRELFDSDPELAGKITLILNPDIVN